MSFKCPTCNGTGQISFVKAVQKMTEETPAQKRHHLAITDNGFLCPNCLKENLCKEPIAGDILKCTFCGDITLVEEPEGG